MIECPNCHTLNSNDNKFCGECGTKLPSPLNYCPECERKYNGEKFCTQCGTKLVNETEYLQEVERLKQEEKRRQEELKKMEEERKLREKRRQEELIKQEEERKNILFNRLYPRMSEETIHIASRCLEMNSTNKKDVISALIEKYNTEEEIYKAIRGQKRKEGYYSSKPSLKWIKCPNCNHAVNAAATNCPYCTHKLTSTGESPTRNNAKIYSSNKIKCPECNKLYNKFKYKSCPECGAPNLYRKI